MKSGGKGKRMSLIETERLTMREILPSDAPFVLALLNEPSFIKNIGDRNVGDLKSAELYIRDRVLASYKEHGFGMYLLALKGDPKTAIGLCGLVKRPSLDYPDIGYALFPDYWGQGYAREAASAVLNYGRKQLKLPVIVGITNPDNQASGRVLEAIGLTFQKMVTLDGGIINRLYG